MDIVEADLSRTDHAQAILELTDAYCRDPSANGTPLPGDVRERLIVGLQRHPTTLVFLAYSNEKPVGLATCFVGFSTFAARPLVNIHDLAVLEAHRGRGVGRRLLAAVEDKARRLECCKVTLEVQEHNHPARRLYEAFGFSQSELRSEIGGALFMSKPL